VRSVTLAVCAVAAVGMIAACSKPKEAEAEPHAAGEGTRRFVALGDSFTIGTGSAPEQAFPARLVSRAPCLRLENPARNGFTSQDLIDRELGALGRAPHLVTVAVGANDIVQGVSEAEYRQNLRVIFARVRESGASIVIALPQPDWSQSPAARAFGDRTSIARLIEQRNAALREEAERAGARFVDLFPLMRAQASRQELAGDGLHPSAGAHDAWAAELARQLGPLCPS
jgi:lysophospholipase L1-like esterase